MRRLPLSIGNAKNRPGSAATYKYLFRCMRAYYTAKEGKGGLRAYEKKAIFAVEL